MIKLTPAAITRTMAQIAQRTRIAARAKLSSFNVTIVKPQ